MIKSEREDRATRIHLEATAIIAKERAHLEQKTARLRELRLGKQDEAAAPVPGVIKKSKRTVVMIKAAMAKRRKP